MIHKLIALILILLGITLWISIGINSGKRPEVKQSTSLSAADVVSPTETSVMPAPPEPSVLTVSPSPKTVTGSQQPAKPATTNSQVTGIPKTIIIPKIGVNAGVEPVGLDGAGRMDVPKKWGNAGWYNLGYKVGVSGGVAVMSGHLDTSSGAPAVFYQLDKLVPGDEFTVVDTGNARLRYRVIEKQVYAFDALPLERIFGSSGIDGLNLITCDGAWNRNARNYSERLVIYSVLVK